MSQNLAGTPDKTKRYHRDDKVHSEKNKFKCETCDTKLSSKQHLKIHISSIHMGSKPYKCEICKIKFSQLGSLNRHFEQTHERKEKKCTLCGKELCSKDSLDTHITVVMWY